MTEAGGLVVGREPGETVPAWAERFEALARHVFDATIVVEEDGTVSEASESLTALLGYEAAKAVGHKFERALDGDGAVAMRTCIEEFAARRRLTAALALRARRFDGEWIDVEAVVANHLDDPIARIVVHLRDVTEHPRAAERVWEAERRHAVIIDSLVDGVMMVNARGVIVRVNPAFESMFGAPTDVMVGRRLADILAMSDTRGMVTVDGDGRPVTGSDHPLLKSLATGERFTGVVHGITHRTEPTVWIRINSQAIFDRAGDTPAGAVATFSDITEGRNAAIELRREERFVQTMLDNVDEGIVACDADGRITIFNQAAKRLHGLGDHVDPIGRIPSPEGLRLADGTPLPHDENPLTRAICGDRIRDLEIVITARSGAERLVTVNGQKLVSDDDRTLGAVVVLRDVTEQKRHQERLADLALRDPLTGLANRILLGERMADALARAADAVPEGPDGDPRVAVFLLDLDDFKQINDAWGHDVGDEVLVAVGRRLHGIVRPSDTVARLGGDEFVVVCDVRAGEEERDRIGARIAAALAEPYRIGRRTFEVAASVGGVLADPDDKDPSKLLSRADDAMYRVKWDRRRARHSRFGGPR